MLIAGFVFFDGYNTIQYNTIKVYCENTLSYNKACFHRRKRPPANLQVFHKYNKIEHIRNKNGIHCD